MNTLIKLEKTPTQEEHSQRCSQNQSPQEKINMIQSGVRCTKPIEIGSNKNSVMMKIELTVQEFLMSLNCHPKGLVRCLNLDKINLICNLNYQIKLYLTNWLLLLLLLLKMKKKKDLESEDLRHFDSNNKI